MVKAQRRDPDVKRERAALRVLLVHPGGPFTTDLGAWTIPKGEYWTDEDSAGGSTARVLARNWARRRWR